LASLSTAQLDVRRAAPRIRGRAVKFLADHLNSDDKVSIVVFADKAKVILNSDSSHDKSTVLKALDDIICSKSAAGTQMALGMRRLSMRSKKESQQRSAEPGAGAD